MVTRFALGCSVVAVGIGIIDPQLFQVKVVGFLAFASIFLSAWAIGMLVWQIELRSRRLSQPLFWLSLLLNLILIAAVAFVYHRGINMSDLQRGPASHMPDGPQN